MKKTILITGATDGIGLASAKSLAALGHDVLLHGRSASKLNKAKAQIAEITHRKTINTYRADLSVIQEVQILAADIQRDHEQIDVLINNAGIYTVQNTQSADGLDPRFVVNAIAPYLLTKKLLPLLSYSGRVVNVSSAAQSPLVASELTQVSRLNHGVAYAKSKLVLTLWSRELGLSLQQGPMIVAVNPASMLGSKMVKEAFGVAGGDVQRGADILVKAALSKEFSEASGLYFDNDIGQFADPHRDVLNTKKVKEVMQVLDKIIANYI